MLDYLGNLMEDASDFSWDASQGVPWRDRYNGGT